MPSEMIHWTCQRLSWSRDSSILNLTWQPSSKSLLPTKEVFNSTSFTFKLTSQRKPSSKLTQFQRTVRMSLVSFWKAPVGMSQLATLNNQSQRKCSQWFLSFIVRPYRFLVKERKTRQFINAQLIRQRTEVRHMCSQPNWRQDTRQENGYWQVWPLSWTYKACQTTLRRRKLRKKSELTTDEYTHNK